VALIIVDSVSLHSKKEKKPLLCLAFDPWNEGSTEPQKTAFLVTVSRISFHSSIVSYAGVLFFRLSRTSQDNITRVTQRIRHIDMCNLIHTEANFRPVNNKCCSDCKFCYCKRSH
jgi:hypothetical protein